MASQSKGAVFQAILGNGFVTLIKLFAFLLSRSPAMLSEAIHSFADTANQTLLYIGIRRSNRPADSRYHWGYGSERFLFALLSAMGIFVLGCGVTVYHGVSALLHPPKVSISWVSFVVLGLSIVIEGYVLMSAVREVYRTKGKVGFWRFLRESSDPTLLAVLFEDFVATLGCVIAIIGIGLAHYTGNPAFDAISSIIIGVMLGFVALWLGWRNSVLMVGPSIPKDVEQGVIKYLKEQPSVDSIRGVRTRIVGSHQFAFAADVDYNGKYLGSKLAEWVQKNAPDLDDAAAIEAFAADFGDRLLDVLAAEIDRIEAKLLKEYPILSFVDLESDNAKKPMLVQTARRRSEPAPDPTPE